MTAENSFGYLQMKSDEVENDPGVVLVLTKDGTQERTDTDLDQGPDPTKGGTVLRNMLISYLV